MCLQFIADNSVYERNHALLQTSSSLCHKCQEYENIVDCRFVHEEQVNILSYKRLMKITSPKNISPADRNTVSLTVAAYATRSLDRNNYDQQKAIQKVKSLCISTQQPG